MARSLEYFRLENEKLKVELKALHERMKMAPQDNALTPIQIEHRKRSFDAWLRKEGDQLGYYLLPSSMQDRVRGFMRKAYNAGSNYESRLNLLGEE